MAILITGGSGFIGSWFHNVLPEQDLINFDLEPPVLGQKSRFAKGDIRHPEDVRNILAPGGIDSILSLAAKHHDFGIRHEEYFDTNADGTRILCEIASEFNIKKFIFFSSVAVYGIREEITTELSELQPSSAYGASKLAGEKVLIKWAAEDSTREVLIIRPTLVFGSNNRANMFNLIRQVDSGYYFHLGKAGNIKSIAYVENLVQATKFLIGKMAPGVSIYNYSDEPQLTAREIGETIAGALGRKIRITIPKPLGVLLGLPFDLLIRATGKNLPISSARIRKLGTRTYHSAGKLFSSGFSPKYSTKEGIIRMVKWYMSL